ncbi:patatin-like phospholipase family protein [Nocardioides currus]|nr:patatin-like phospholipase family protein [Nocardioides currus]
MGTDDPGAARLRERASYLSTERECDVVMKGGITSGVLYPLAVCELATTYRLRNVGGTSAGAIAAAAAAAAEIGRTSGAPGSGFDGLATLPDWLGSEDHLIGLFQPSARTENLHGLLVRAVSPGPGGLRRTASLVLGLVGYGLRTGRAWLGLLGAVPGVLLLVALLGAEAWESVWGWLGLVVAVVVTLAGLAVGAAYAAVKDAGEALDDNLYGIVTGSQAVAGRESLCDWLADKLDELAGRPRDGTPLTFGDLWDSAPEVVLEMQTTNVTEGRPYRLPEGLGGGFAFDEAEFRRIFPARVVDHLVDVGGERVEGGLVPMPSARDLPVVVATRMSLSFPILISAVPLRAIDQSLAKPDGTGYEPSWFSDGGITSNFPVSFFDALLPSRPTFGITLGEFHPRYPQSDDERCNVWMPRTNQGGQLEWWTRWQGAGLGGVVGFLTAILDAMQNWVDNTQTRVPGYRDRIVHISHNDDEGGMNLAMPPETLARLAERGRQAGRLLLDTYTHGPEEDRVPDPCRPGQTLPRRVVSWENHRWVRLRTSLALLSDAVTDFAEQLTPDYADDLASPFGDAPSYQFTNLDQQALARSLVADLRRIAADIESAEASGANVPLEVGAPRPAPVLRIAPAVRASERDDPA